ncbi:MAG: IS66 family transposase [Actinomycetes bacterium]
MKLLSQAEASHLELDEARTAAANYSKLVGQMASQYEQLEQKYRKLFEKLQENPQELFWAQEVLKNLQAELYGKSSEKRPNAAPAPGVLDGDEIKTTDEKKKRARSGPSAQLKLAVVEVPHRLSEAERSCGSCGGLMKPWEGQFEESERIQVLPAQFILERHLRQKYICSCGGCIKTAPGPLKLKEGGRYSPEFGIHVGLQKYEFHLPLERQVRMMKQSGLEITSQTLFAQIDTIAWYLKPHVYRLIGEQVRSSPFVAADETPWENLGKGAKKRFYLWGIRSPKAVYFQVADSRRSEVAGELTAGVRGILMCDGYAGYNSISSETLILAHCWSHVRRKFLAAERSHPEESKVLVDLIRALYDVETAQKAFPFSADRVLLARQEQSLPILEKIYQQLWNLKAHLPRSALGKAVDYTLKLWKGLIVFADYPMVPLDNNAMERTIRGPVVGRKNHYGSKNIKTGEVAAIWYTVIETCKGCGVDSKEYLKRALTDILTGKTPPMPWAFAVESVSETVVSETQAGLTTKVAENGSIAASESVS